MAKETITNIAEYCLKHEIAPIYKFADTGIFLRMKIGNYDSVRFGFAKINDSITFVQAFYLGDNVLAVEKIQNNGEIKTIETEFSSKEFVDFATKRGITITAKTRIDDLIA